MHILLRTEGLCKTFSQGGLQQHVLKNLDIQIPEGEFTVIMGSSGSGKSTLLYALSGMDKPTIGNVYIDGLDITSYTVDQLAVFRRNTCGFVFQQVHLLDNMSILDNILVSGLLVSKNRKETVSAAKELLLQAGITEAHWGKFPSQLSGGEAQRAGIVRALINKPRIVFADEPTGALNSSSGAAVLDMLTEIHEKGQTLVTVTHDIKTVVRGNRILYLKDGTVSGEYVPGNWNAEYAAERTEMVQEFLSGMGW